ncbi:MAG: HAMP domain-containing sensor histidine kinase [Candidatus Thermoplasmatota archaeon]|nr:HAMP domain-containing sensor histidine kinase [Candidatus Thermoplasmatota archaeon]
MSVEDTDEKEGSPEDSAISQSDMCRVMDMLAHDIDNYVSTSIGYLDIIDHMLGENVTARRYSEMARTSSFAVSRSLEKLNTILKARTETIFLERIDLHPVIDEAISDAVSGSVLDPQIDIEIGTGRVVVYGDRFLRPMLAELLHNSFKAAGERKPWIRVSFIEDERGSALIIEDDSGGMSDRIKERGPLRFRNLLKNSDHHGSGLGLSMVHEIAARYGWAFRLKDRVPEDSTKGLRAILRIPKTQER